MKEINNSKKIIVVEGDDDFHFLCNILEIQGINDVFVEKINGKSKLKKALDFLVYTYTAADKETNE
ncbi:hypothetical protein [Klebsiella pneumoniae]|uniref:hypothetical protein n=1 Tax=Klebsiella pneumoniae TaxID=573 RepID=UPI001F4AF8D3|nr:hypothetical protein [Klebsiella pneumoniae]